MIVLLFLTSTLASQAVRESLTNAVPSRLEVVPWTPKSRQAHQTEWFSVRLQTNSITGKVRAFTNSFVELATGLNVPDATGNFVPANPTFQITERGAEALLTGHSVLLAPNINSAGAVQVSKGDIILKSHPLALGYYDPVDGRTVILSELQDSIGLLTGPSEVTYTNCFRRIRASIRLKNSLAGLAQDLILHEAPPPPEELGLSIESRLELFTEYLPDTPMPVATSRIIRREADTVKRATMVEPDFEDATLTFAGTLRMGPGRAFALPTNSTTRANLSRPVPVGKWFGVIEQRPILIEAVQHYRIRPMLTNLPPARLQGILTNAAISSSSSLFVHSRNRKLPTPPLAIHTGANIQLAMRGVKSDEPAFVLDYDLLQNGYAENFTFESAKTYLVRDYYALGGTTQIMPGTVVKYDRWSWLEIWGPIECKTEPYRPAVFTAISDESVGERNLPGSEGTPNGTYASVALYIAGGDSNLKHLRVSYADTAIMCYYGGNHTVSHSQFLHGYNPLYGEYGTFNVRNVLVQDVSVVFLGIYSSFQVEHLTAHQCTWLAYDYYGTTCQLNLVNSLAVSVPYNGISYTQDQFHWDNDESRFETVGSGSHYLKADSPLHGQGTPSITPSLLADLKKKTTYSPIYVTGLVDTDVTLPPVVPRQVEGNPDIGYAYDVIDCLASGLTLANHTLIITNGAIVAVDFSAANYGFRLNSGKLISEGTPLNPNRIVWAHAVQENSMAAGNSVAHTFEDGYLGTSPSPRAHFRFTVLSQLAGGYHHFYGGNYLDNFVIRDCEISSGKIFCSYYGVQGRLISWTNNLFLNTDTRIITQSPTFVNVYNSTFVGGTINFENSGGPLSNWSVRDNIFDTLYLSDNGWPIGNSHNYTRDVAVNPQGRGLANSDIPRPFTDTF